MPSIFIKIAVETQDDSNYFGWIVNVVNGSQNNITVKNIVIGGPTKIPPEGSFNVLTPNLAKIATFIKIGSDVSFRYNYRFGRGGHPYRYDIQVLEIEAFNSDGSPVSQDQIDVQGSKG